MENENRKEMTVEELLAKKLSNEIDIDVLTEVMKSAEVPQSEIEKHVDILRKNSDLQIERELLGGKNKIHGAKE